MPEPTRITSESRVDHRRKAHRTPQGLPVAERFWAKVAGAGDLDSCWTWTAAIADTGYGKFNLGRGKTVTAHRWSYEQMRGEIPAGLHLDHLCRNRACVNPWHLEPVTSAENTARSPIHNGTRTHCPQGHPYDEANTYRWGGRRYCRTCQRAIQETRRAKLAERDAKVMPLIHPLPEAAEILGLAESYLRAKVKAREVPFVQIGQRSVGFTDEQLAQVIESLSVQPRQDPQRLTTSRARKRAA